jgi:GntR family transcriptional repressor for pyruvate dehydrogenase complex
MFQPVKASRVSDEIVLQVRKVLMSGRVNAGDRLPTERQLAEQFGTSRASVREALRGLEQEGMIYVKKGASGGVFVANVDHQLVTRPMETLFRMKKVSIQQITEARLIFEPEAARLAATRATPEDLVEMEEVIGQMDQAVRSGKTYASYDLKFHQLIARAARNPIIEMLAGSMLEVASRIITELRPSIDVLRHVTQCHSRVYKAVRERNSQLAHKMMLEHIIDVQERLVESEQKKTRTQKAAV